ncbi:MAG: Dph6-related ATP pyrophosphatase [Planctomycetota bacterium]
MKKVLLSWSSGKDSAWALHVLRGDPSAELTGLLTTTNSTNDRVSMHGVPRPILEAQARAADLPIRVVPLPFPCSNEAYEEAMRRAVAEAVERGVTHVAFGDIFLEDVRKYRERQMEKTPLEPIFPIWGLSTADLSREMMENGLEAIVTCIDTKHLPSSLAGRRYDRAFLDALPEGIDPCGERGEFHTCVLNAPGFRAPIRARAGKIVERDGFTFAEVVKES